MSDLGRKKYQSTENHERKLENEIANRTPLMSNAKWLKIFDLLTEIRPKRIKAKLLLYEETIDLSVFFDGETYFETLAGAFYYKEIEWIFIPKQIEKELFNRNEKLKSVWEENPIADIEISLNKIGQFAYEKDENGITIFGYK